MCKKGNISLIIIDSISSHYRRLVKHNPEFANNLLNSQLRTLSSLGIPIIITNQVYSDLNSDIQMIGKNIISKYASLIIELKIDPRKIEIKNKLEKKFEINNQGIYFTS